MEAKELRIGNLVLDDELETFRISGFSPYGHSVRCDEEEGCMVLGDIYYNDGLAKRGYEAELHDLQPIPITEEWLLKFGFESYDLELGTRVFYNIKTFIVEVGGWSNPIYYTQEKVLISYIEHIHQLQNLFFGLTGEELTIKEEQ